MKNIATKGPAFVWMGLAVTAVIVLVANVIVGGLFLYLCGLFISLISAMPMVADAVLCIIRARKRLHPTLNIILAVMLIIGAILAVLSMHFYRLIVLWAHYLLPLMAVEVVSILLLVKASKTPAKEQTINQETICNENT